MIGDSEWLDNLTRYSLPEFGEIILVILQSINNQGLEEEVRSILLNLILGRLMK